MECPKCGERSLVVRTVRHDRGEVYVDRYRKCRDPECCFRWSTREVHKVTGPDEHALDAEGPGGRR